MKRLLLLLLVALPAAMLPAQALGDGDPASDFLVFGPAYYPLQPAPQKALRDEMTALLRTAKAQRHPLRVAVIRNKADLGAVPQLFGKPTVYARFLGAEIAYAYKGPLLIVMPQGFGTKNIPPARQKVLRSVKIDASSPDAMTQSSLAASKKLLSAAGMNVAAASAQAPAAKKSSDSNTLVIAGAAVVAVLVVGTLGLVLVRMRQRPA
jgi:hypothetical protein